MSTDVNQTVLINIDELQVGMFVQLDMGWLAHPFPMSRFRISSEEQIQTLRGLGLTSIRYLPAKSMVQSAAAPVSEPSDADASAQDVLPEPPEQPGEENFRHAAMVYEDVIRQLGTAPLPAREQAQALVESNVAQLLAQPASAVRLLAEGMGQGMAAHAVNVMVLALLLGKALGMEAEPLLSLGMAALLHDMGKADLPLHIAEPGARLAPADWESYRSHVGLSVEHGQRMGLHSDILIAMAQHHEMADGSGFPLRLLAEDLGRYGQILALVNCFDRLSNPLHGVLALTPHEAVSQLFAAHKNCFDAAVLGTFVRMMGVYPPGSLVQLTDGRYALVVKVDPAQPLNPCVVLYDPGVRRVQAPDLDLASQPGLGIRRSLKPGQLPRGALDYLLPQQRACYFFERAAQVADVEARP